MTTTIGLIFDFDDTLAPDSTTQLLNEYDVDPVSFWSETFQSRVRDGYDPTVAYLSALVERFGVGGSIAELTTEDLAAVGEALSAELYPGLPGLFDDIDEIAAEYQDVTVERYIISEGIESIIRSTAAASHCDGVYASEFATTDDGQIAGIKRPVSFTDKTRYLFEINKGIDSTTSHENPYAVNERMDQRERHIPFENVIYVGDGLTDVPCFSLVKERGGRAFGVVDEENGSPKQRAIRAIGAPRRTSNLHHPSYEPGTPLGSLIRLTIEGLCTDRALDDLEAL